MLFPRRLARFRWLSLPICGALLTVILGGCGALAAHPTHVSATYSTHIQTPVPTPQASSVVYQASLIGSTPGWSSNPVCDFTSAGLVIKPSGGQAYICLAPTSPIANGSISVTVTRLSGAPDHAFGIAFRHNEPKSYYFFGVDGRGRFTLDVVTNDVSQTIIPFTVSPAVRAGTGAVNTLNVATSGQTVLLTINGTQVAQATIAAFTSGAVGLRGINAGSVRFTQLTVTQSA